MNQQYTMNTINMNNLSVVQEESIELFSRTKSHSFFGLATELHRNLVDTKTL